MLHGSLFIRAQDGDAQSVVSDVVQTSLAALAGLRGMKAPERVVDVEKITRRVSRLCLEAKRRTITQLPCDAESKLRFARARFTREQERLAKQQSNVDGIHEAFVGHVAGRIDLFCPTRNRQLSRGLGMSVMRVSRIVWTSHFRPSVTAAIVGSVKVVRQPPH